jgi:nucleoside-diphosphate-sugar epimerase
MIAVLGAGGSIGDELIKELVARKERVRLVSRSPKLVPGAAEAVAADLATLGGALNAVSGCRTAFLLVGLKYDLRVWRELWPRIVRNAIEAAKRFSARLVFFDNVYMYGRVDGAMTEETPFRPCSRKGEVRAEIATMLLNEIRAGNLTAIIARSADFYGPRARTSIPNILVFENYARGKRAMWPASDSVKHSLTFTPDAARSLVLLAESENAWNQTWHIPTAPDPPTGKQVVELVANELGTQPKYRVLTRPMVWTLGLFDPTVRELYEMLYQYESDYIFDSTKFTKAFHFESTSYAVGIRQTAEPYRQ